MIYSCLGGAGVDFFFVLSGFIIFYIHHEDFHQPELFRPYVRKRLVRVYPIYWMVVIPVILFNFIFPAISNPNERMLSNVLQSFFLIPQGHLPVLGVAWTLSHELLFYAIFAVNIWFRGSKVNLIFYSWIILLLLFLILSIVSPAAYAALTLNSYLVQFVSSGLNLEFSLGMFAALLFVNNKVKNGIVWFILGFVLFLLAGLNDVYWSYSFISDGGLSNRIIAFGLPSFLMVLGGAEANEQLQKRFHRIFQHLGDSSYSLYLIHYPLIVVGCMVGAKIGISPLLLGMILVLASIVIGLLCHFIVEKPLIRFANRRLATSNV